jgi:hypothetical protein
MFVDPPPTFIYFLVTRKLHQPQNYFPQEINLMKLAIRVTALAFIVAAAFAGNPRITSSAVPPNVQASVPGGGGPMPTCNPFTQVCPPIR